MKTQAENGYKIETGSLYEERKNDIGSGTHWVHVANVPPSIKSLRAAVAWHLERV